MPWTGAQFAAKHNKKLSGSVATKAAKIATAMVDRGVPEGEAIATANARADGEPRRAKSPGLRGRKRVVYKGPVMGELVTRLVEALDKLAKKLG